MDLLKSEDVSSVMVFDIRISESELELLSDALSFLLRTLDDKELNNVVTGEEGGTLMRNLPDTRAFIEDRLGEMMTILVDNCRKEFLPKRFANWGKE